MGAKADLEKRIEQEKQKLIDLQSQLEKAQAFVQGLEEALRFIPREREVRQSRGKISGKLRAGSDIEKVHNLLRQTGSPMHVSKILVAIGREDTEANRLSLAGSLGRYVRADAIFRRVGPNLFTLKELDTRPKMPLELPKDFGK